MKRTNGSEVLRLGSDMPSFCLPSTSGEVVNSSKLNGEAYLIIFMCNHCPYVTGSIRLINQTVAKYLNKGLVTVGINSNDPVKYPQDSFDNMISFAKEMELCFPYCFDESQEIARAFDAACTPEAYLFDRNRKLIYHGGVVDNPLNPQDVKRNWLDEVLNEYFTQGSLSNLDTSNFFAEGCSIKWR